MAQTKKKRQRKRRGTQGGRVDASSRSGRPRSREEAKARARAKRKGTPRIDAPPSWRSATIRGAVAAVIFAALLVVLFSRPIGTAVGLAALMLVFYVPAGYYFDMVMWRRRERARDRSAGKQ